MVTLCAALQLSGVNVSACVVAFGANRMSDDPPLANDSVTVTSPFGFESRTTEASPAPPSLISSVALVVTLTPRVWASVTSAVMGAKVALRYPSVGMAVLRVACVIVTRAGASASSSSIAST